MLRPRVSDRKYLQVTQAIPPHATFWSRSANNSGPGGAQHRPIARRLRVERLCRARRDRAALRHVELVDAVPVFPNQGTKKFGCRIRLQRRQRLAGHAFAGKSRRPGIAPLRNPCPMAITARTVATEEQLVLMSLQEIGSEGWIAGERVVARVG
jgi:hypothetical protein